MPKISLVTTTYNRAEFLPKCIESVLKQEADFEYLIWDDGSTDDTEKIIQPYLSDNRIRYTWSRNQGNSHALKSALSSAKGEWVGIVDADDWLDPTCLNYCQQWIAKNPDVGMFYTHYYDVFPDGKKALGMRCMQAYSPHNLLTNFMTFHFRLLKREVYQEVGGIDTTLPYAQDYDLCLKVSEVAEIMPIPIPLYYYRHHDKPSVSVHQEVSQIVCSRRAVEEAIKRRGLQNRLEVKYWSVFTLY